LISSKIVWRNFLEKRTKKHRTAIGLDLGGTKLAAALFSVSGDGETACEQALENRKYAEIIGSHSPDSIPAAKKAELIVEAMARAAQDLAGGIGEQPEVIGVCSAGFVERGRIIEAWNTGMKNFPLKARIEEETGLKTFLYKDSWAPVYALRSPVPAIIFSIGTGFGGVSCEPDLAIPVRSYSARMWPQWIPCLRANDDPGYAVAFSPGRAERVISRQMAESAELDGAGEITGNRDGGEFAGLLVEQAKKEGRMTPSKIELFAARLLAPRAMSNMRHGEVFADLPCGAKFPSTVYSWLTGRRESPKGMDRLIKDKDPAAAAAFRVHAGFIGQVIFEMQKERIEHGLDPADRVFATGSGYNAVNEGFLSSAIFSVVSRLCSGAGIDPPGEKIELIETHGLPTTFACLGAATGAALGIE